MLRKTALPIALTIVFLLAGAGVVQAVENARPPTAPFAAPVGTAFTYQGYLADGGAPADGFYDFQFMLYDDPGAGAPVGSTVTKDNVDVAEGYFTVELDFGIVFDGTAL